ncbi:hypothetical protein [Enterococcus sp. BWT-B8]|uniref:hypothetical protein n=1 Tax=Enterococcus sp. BWT-B8 TaxID=2885157 RepID=UPI001E55EE32|nr:hypothetical protein [Enterococcus sp. BWT-B8]MCB5953698.1 hypothetical protein [Enterococcus sp. CWB-B31]
MLKQINCFLLILGSITLTFLFSSQQAQATVTNGNIHYFEESSTESSTQSESSTDDSSSTSESSTTNSSSTSTTDTQNSGAPTQPQNSGQSAPIVKEGTDGNFLKTNDTVNYLFVVVGVIFVLIAIYNLKRI